MGFTDIINQCAASMRQLSAFASNIEEGQADSPLRDHGNKISHVFEGNVRKFNLISFANNSLSVFFGSILDNENGLIISTLEDKGFSGFIDLTESQYFLLINNEKLIFQDIDSLLKALPVDVKNLKSVGIVKPDLLAPTIINVLDKQALLFLDITCVNQMVNHSPVLMVAAPDKYNLMPEERGAYIQAISNTAYLWPNILEALPEQSTSQNWLQEAIPGNLKIIPAWRHSIDGQLAGLLQGNPTAEIDAINAYGYIQHAKRYADMLNLSMSDISHSAAFQLQANEVLLEIAGNTSDYDDQTQNIRKTVSIFKDNVGAIQKNLQTRSRYNLAGQHVYPQLVDSVLDEIKENDLTRSQEHKSFRLELSEQSISGIKEDVWKNIVQRHDDETKEYLDGIKQLIDQSDLNKQSFMQSFRNKFGSIEGQLSDINQLKTLLDFKARYKGEMQQRGFLKRLGEGRRVVFMILMIFSIGGSMVGFNYREYSMIGIIFLLVFLGASFYTFISWKKDEKFQLKKEIEKARDQIRMDVLRSITDVERERLTRLNEWFQESFQDLQRDFEDWRIASQKEEKQRVDQSRSMTKSKDTKLQSRIRELDKFRQEIAKIKQQLEQMEQQHMKDAEAIGFR